MATLVELSKGVSPAKMTRAFDAAPSGRRSHYLYQRAAAKKRGRQAAKLIAQAPKDSLTRNTERLGRWTAGQGVGNRRESMRALEQMSKAVRPYDPEDKRQRNSGILPGLAAGGAVATGAQTARQFERPQSLRQVAGRVKRGQVPLRVKAKVKREWSRVPIDRNERIITQRVNPQSGKWAQSATVTGDLHWKQPHAKGAKAAARRAGRARAGKWGAATVGLTGLAAYGAHRAGSKKNRRWE